MLWVFAVCFFLFLVVLWVFAERFFFWLCCEYFQSGFFWGCVVSICRAFLYLVVLWVFAVCFFFFWLCCEYLQCVSFFLVVLWVFAERFGFFGCVVSIFSVCVVKLTKVVFLICRRFFSICSAFLYLVVSICSACIVKLRKLLSEFAGVNCNVRLCGGESGRDRVGYVLSVHNKM